MHQSKHPAYRSLLSDRHSCHKLVSERKFNVFRRLHKKLSTSACSSVFVHLGSLSIVVENNTFRVTSSTLQLAIQYFPIFSSIPQRIDFSRALPFHPFLSPADDGKVYSMIIKKFRGFSSRWKLLTRTASKSVYKAFYGEVFIGNISWGLSSHCENGNLMQMAAGSSCSTSWRPRKGMLGRQ